PPDHASFPTRRSSDLRSELPQAAVRVSGQGIAFSAGIGLYKLDWMEQLRTSFVLLIENLAAPSLTDVLREARARWSSLADCEDRSEEHTSELQSRGHL